jgi:hypothetical protein
MIEHKKLDMCQDDPLIVFSILFPRDYAENSFNDMKQVIII